MANTGYIGVGPADRDPTVSDDSVTTAKIQNAAVTALKLDTTGTASSSTFLRGDFSWQANAGGDVVGPGSSTDDALAKFDSTTGKIIQNSTATLSDAGTLTATAFAGALTGNVTGNVTGDVTGNVSGTAATVTGATQSNITALGTIASLVATTADINGGTFDGIVGGTTPAAGTFTTATATTSVTDGQLQFLDNAGGEYVALQASGTTTTYTVTLPAAAATSNGQALTSATNGVASWTDVGDASLATAQEWTATQNFDGTTLSFNATQAWNVQTDQVTKVVLTANIIFAAPTNQKDGGFYSIICEQDGTGGWTGSWNGVFKWAGGAASAPVLTTTASAKDIFVFRSDGTNMYEVGRQLNVS